MFLHCFIHQEVLCKSALDIKHVLDVVIKLVNQHSIIENFESFLTQCSLNICTKVGCLSAGCVFERVWYLKDEIISIRGKKGMDECKNLIDNVLLSDFAFFTDLSYINKLNLKLPGRNQLIHDVWSHIRGFKMQLNLFSKQLVKKDYSFSKT